jgi:hypothetical protein
MHKEFSIFLWQLYDVHFLQMQKTGFWCPSKNAAGPKRKKMPYKVTEAFKASNWKKDDENIRIMNGRMDTKYPSLDGRSEISKK